MEPDSKSLHRITLQLPVPIQDSKTLLKLLQLELQSRSPNAPVKRVLLTIDAAEPRKVQGELFIPPGPEPQRMEITLARIKAIAGENRVGSPVLQNTHRPDAFQMQRFSPSEETLGARTARPRFVLDFRSPAAFSDSWRAGHPRSQGYIPTPPHSALRRFRPAIPTRVELKEDRPVLVTFLNQRCEVLAHAGPWRNNGDWWAESFWTRDEWDVTLQEKPCQPYKAGPFKAVPKPEAAVYRIYLDLHKQQWFVEGVYD